LVYNMDLLIYEGQGESTLRQISLAVRL
jgi:hypothetical protein